ncbi:hypothetical protein [Sinorhizobium sp. A49]|uniref:hypothetical protein n=1 Tax=Sinorhizobium sp. A49 TaxID=1945861 RepID=UPI0011155128|nr:hypothetical protein [Sinorhizobium sp. A49]
MKCGNQMLFERTPVKGDHLAFLRECQRAFQFEANRHTNAFRAISSGRCGGEAPDESVAPTPQAFANASNHHGHPTLRCPSTFSGLNIETFAEKRQYVTVNIDVTADVLGVPRPRT